MERSFGLLLVLIATLPIIHLVQAQRQGFISLDCGLPANEVSSYTEPETGLHYHSDADYIQSGEIGTVPVLETERLKPYWTLRYFLQGTRNCYNLPVEKGRKYLIRAWFIYGNYDGLDVKPNFDLYLGPNRWATVDMQKPGKNDTLEEILHIPTSNSLQICLVKTGETTPLISALELRPIGNRTYTTETGSLELVFRRFYGESSVPRIRYPEDDYDRLWTYDFLPDCTSISTTSDVFDPSIYNLPKAVRQNAVTPTNASAPLTIEWSSENPNDKYYLHNYYAETQDLQANETREFNEFLNGGKLNDRPQTIPKLEVFGTDRHQIVDARVSG